MRYEDKEGGRPKETEKERHGGTEKKERETWMDKKKLPGETEKHIVKNGKRKPGRDKKGRPKEL